MLPVRIDTEAVAVESREDMEVGMKYLLEGGFTVCQKKVHSLASKAASPQGFGESVAYAEHMCPRFLVQFLKRGGVVFGNDQEVARIYRTGVHKSENALVLEDNVGGHAASNYLAKAAVSTVRGHKGILPVMPSRPGSGRRTRESVLQRASHSYAKGWSVRGSITVPLKAAD